MQEQTSIITSYSDLLNIATWEIKQAIIKLYGSKAESIQTQIQNTRKEFDGDITLVVFPLLKLSKKSPETTANDIGQYLSENNSLITTFNAVKGFLNLSFKNEVWISLLDARNTIVRDDKEQVMVEYSSPNTNKPLHLGHIRNNLLGYSLANILGAAGKKVIKVNLINDRGIHICKSMLAWKKYGEGETPESSGLKGDHLVGKYYVRFDKEYQKQVNELVDKGIAKEDAEQQVDLMKEIRDLLLKWENNDTPTRELWKMMNGWVYEGFNKTYKDLGVNFDQWDYESQTYLLGKDIVIEGLNKGIFYQKKDGSIWADLTDYKLDQKLLLRADGTSVYITQDIGTAIQRFEKHKLDRLIYVVGDEQNHHFKVLKAILDRLGYLWADKIYHLSYGMVDLPTGKMKSREGTVVDADDLMQEMLLTAQSKAQDLGKLEGLNEQEGHDLYKTISLGALKYFILKVDPKKRMMFNPEDSIDFNGNTGPFIQYTYARIQSLLRRGLDIDKTDQLLEKFDVSVINLKERELLKNIAKYSIVLNEAAQNFSPAIIANYVYDLAKEFNSYYQEVPILRVEDVEMKYFRLLLAEKIAEVIKISLEILGIDAPDRM